MSACKARMAIEAKNAEALRQAIAADNQEYVKAYIEGGSLIALAEASSIGSMLTTLDDLLINLKVADEMLHGRGTSEGHED